jgi:hypothetical protein
VTARNPLQIWGSIIWALSEKFFNMTDRNSTTEMHYRPEEVQQLLEIKSTTYYERTKFLGIKAQKDDKGNAYLNQEQFDQLQRLGEHIQQTGKMQGFLDGNGDLALAAESSILNAAATPAPQDEPVQPGMEDEIIRMAAELKGQQLVMMPLVVQELASRMTYEDLPPDVRAKVDSVRESASPKFQPSQVASSILDQWRNRNQQPATV